MAVSANHHRKPTPGEHAATPVLDAVLDPRHLRPTKRQKQRNDKLIHLLTSAVSVLIRDGHAKLSMRSVAAEAGVSLSSMQHYFETKDILVIEAIRTFLRGYVERYTAVRYQRNLPAADALNIILEDIASEAGKPEICGLYFEIWALGRHEQAIGDLLIEIYDDYRALFAELIRDIDPSLTDAEANEIGLLIAAQSEGLVVMNFHSSARGRLPESVAERMKRMWPALARLTSDTPSAKRRGQC